MPRFISNSPIPTDDDEVLVCPTCDGDGFDDEYDEVLCSRCWGMGEVPVLS